MNPKVCSLKFQSCCFEHNGFSVYYKIQSKRYVTINKIDKCGLGFFLLFRLVIFPGLPTAFRAKFAKLSLLLLLRKKIVMQIVVRNILANYVFYIAISLRQLN